jgi:glutamate synthase domain-containing protein 3
VATQNPELRARFTGNPDHVECFMRFIAQELREYMAELGFRTVDEMVGRVDMLDFTPAADHWKAHGVDLQALLTPPRQSDVPRHRTTAQDHQLEKALDNELLRHARPALENAEVVDVEVPVRNVDRTVGATLSHHVTKKYGARGLPDDTITFRFNGSAGQSFGAFLTHGITFRVAGDANDYTGKGLSGGRIIVVPPSGAKFVPHENVIVGNVVLYGATDGEMFIHGVAGERFAVRNSGATAVVEGVGDHGCEYMTGGVVVVLGGTGVNFAAGMSGGIAYVYDENELFGTRCNLDMVNLESVWTEEDKHELRTLIQRHFEYTGSARARMVLETWETAYPLFVKVMPIEYKRVLERMKQNERSDNETIPATEEVYGG